MRFIKHLTTWLLLLTVITASGIVSAKVVSGSQNLSGGLHQAETGFNSLIRQAKIDFSTDAASGSPVAAKNATKPLLGKNPTLGKNKNRINTELEGGTATAKSIFRNQTKGQKVTQQPLGPKGGTRRVAEDGTQIRLPNNGSGARVDLPGRGSAGRETIHFTP